MKNRLAVAVILSMLWTGAAHGYVVSVCQDKGPGTTRKAEPTIATFLEHMAGSMGEDPADFQGAYLNRRGSCDAHVTTHRSVFAVLDADTLLAHGADWKVVPIAHLGTATQNVWHVLVRDDSTTALPELAGQPIMSAAPGGERFVANLVLHGAVDAGSLKLKGTAKPLKALRHLARGKVEAAIVDQAAVAALADLKLPVKLRVLTKSEPLPGLTLATIQPGSTSAPPALVKRLRGALGRLCEGEGEALCKTLGVTGFTPVAAGWWKKLGKRYAP